jgi:hypothetical protein
LEHVSSVTLASTQAKFEIDERIACLNQAADWRDEIRGRLAHAANDVWSTPDLDALRTEVERFKLGCKGVRA